MDIRPKVRHPSGVEINFEATDGTGRRWRFDVSGAFTIRERAGLQRTDTLWKALGKAAALYFAELDHPDPPSLVLITTHRPNPRSVGNQALAAVCGPGRPIRGVVNMGPDAVEMGPYAAAQLREITSSE